ncbi:hypothetical protein [Camelimonas lactis]|uniref:hypothetical protein n=1 Tax=Camelimonas lactis TaxID=659006 RepID=UPI0010484E01|nr:hypothetical protein [Camelimonas lactis]
MNETERQLFTNGVELFVFRSAYVGMLVRHAKSLGAEGKRFLDDLEKTVANGTKNISPETGNIPDAVLQEAVRRTLTSIHEAFDKARANLAG